MYQLIAAVYVLIGFCSCLASWLLPVLFLSGEERVKERRTSFIEELPFASEAIGCLTMLAFVFFWPIAIPVRILMAVDSRCPEPASAENPKPPSQRKTGKRRKQTEVASQFVGREGRCITDLRPSGVIEIDGRRHDAITDSYVARDRRVTVTVRQGDTLRVEPAQDD